MISFLTSLIPLFTSGVDAFKEDRKAKKEQALKEIQIQNNIKLKEIELKERGIIADLENSNYRIRQMERSWMDELTGIVVLAPAVLLMISPFVDMFYTISTTGYTAGLLLSSTTAAISALSMLPMIWMMLLVLVVLYSWGADRTTINRMLDIVSLRRNKNEP